MSNGCAVKNHRRDLNNHAFSLSKILFTTSSCWHMQMPCFDNHTMFFFKRFAFNYFEHLYVDATLVLNRVMRHAEKLQEILQPCTRELQQPVIYKEEREKGKSNDGESKYTTHHMYFPSQKMVQFEMHFQRT
jgi:hypothetical protein